MSYDTPSTLLSRMIPILDDFLPEHGVKADTPEDYQAARLKSFEDLHLDSLDRVEFIMGVEDTFLTGKDDNYIPDEDAEKMNTLGDVIDYLMARKVN